MIGATKLERNIDLSFNIGQVKESIDRVIKMGSYTLQNKNDILNTYRISKLTGLEIATFNIVLKKLDDENTSIHLEVIERLRNSGHQIAIDQMIDAFLERLSKALVGESDEELKQVSKANSGCVVTLLLLASGVAAAYTLI
jgi:hypothetical protein